MQQNTVRVGVLAVVTLWALAGTFMVASWLVWMLGVSNDAAELLGLTAAVFIGPATVAHCKLYACRLALIIRATGGHRPQSPVDLTVIQN